MVLGVPGTDGNLVHRSLSLFATSPDPITVRFQTDFLSTQGHRDSYDRLLRNLDKHFPDFSCVNMFIHGAFKSKPIAYTMAQGNTKRACDRCTNSKRLCVRLERMEDGSGMKQVVFPLAEAYRSGKEVVELGFWVRGLARAVMME
jgi:hypothetical protein